MNHGNIDSNGKRTIFTTMLFTLYLSAKWMISVSNRYSSPFFFLLRWSLAMVVVVVVVLVFDRRHGYNALPIQDLVDKSAEKKISSGIWNKHGKNLPLSLSLSVSVKTIIFFDSFRKKNKIRLPSNHLRSIRRFRKKEMFFFWHNIWRMIVCSSVRSFTIYHYDD